MNAGTGDHRALCGRIDAALADRVFFGRVNSAGAARHADEDIEYAQHLCAACPLRQACLSEALSVPERYDRYGIRAGLLPGERKVLRVRLRVVVKATGEEWTGGPIGDVRRRPPHENLGA